MEQWYADTTDWDVKASAYRAALGSLPLTEQQQVTRFMFAKDQKLALASRLLQRRLIHDLFQIPLASITIERTKEKKPFWKRLVNEFPVPRGWNYNVSHHGNVTAIASHPSMLVGVDVVQLTGFVASQSALNEFFRAFQTHFLPSEWKYIRQRNGSSIAGQYRAFYQLWSLKEAYIKAIGIGLGLDLLRAEFSVDDQTKWRLRLDGKDAPQWHFSMKEVCGGTHLITVALGPIDDEWSSDCTSIFPSSDGMSVESPLEVHQEVVEVSAPWTQRTLMDLQPHM